MLNISCDMWHSNLYENGLSNNLENGKNYILFFGVPATAVFASADFRIALGEGYFWRFLPYLLRWLWITDQLPRTSRWLWLHQVGTTTFMLHEVTRLPGTIQDDGHTYAHRTLTQLIFESYRSTTKINGACENMKN